MDERTIETESLSDSYVAEAIQAVDQGLFRFDPRPEPGNEQLILELMKLWVKPRRLPIG